MRVAWESPAERMRIAMRRWALGAVTSLLLLAACRGSGGDSAAQPLLVMAATSLGETMAAMIDRFEAETGIAVDLSLGATGSLAAQMEHGAPADLFFSADRETVERLAVRGTIVPESIRDFALGDLVVVWRADVPGAASIEDLAAPRFEGVGLPNPETAPDGAAAGEALRRAGLWDAIAPRIVLGEGVAQTYQLVRSGNVDAAVVARSLLVASDSNFLPIDAALHAPIRHAVGALAEGRLEEAERFVDFVFGEEGQAILAGRGFRPVPDRP